MPRKPRSLNNTFTKQPLKKSILTPSVLLVSVFILSVGLIVGFSATEKKAQSQAFSLTPVPEQRHKQAPYHSIQQLPKAESVVLQPLKTSSPKSTASPVKQRNLLRVGLTKDEIDTFSYNTTHLGANGSYRLIDDKSHTELYKAQANEDVLVKALGEILEVSILKADKSTKLLGQFSEPLLLKTDSPSSRLKVLDLMHKGRVPEYRGTFEVKLSQEKPETLVVINELDIDEYLKAVVPNELPIGYGVEAVRAQAVAARNYAVMPREKPWHDFDICDSQYCQAYYGSHTETLQTSQVLDETEGLFALYHGQPILALFCSAHGGVSEAYHNVFADPDTNQFPALPLPYLQRVTDSQTVAKQFPDLSTEAAARRFWSDSTLAAYDKTSPLYRWSYQWPRQQLESILNSNLAELSSNPLTNNWVKPAFTEKQTLGTFKRLSVLQRGASGKVMRLAIEGSNGTWELSKEYVIRKALRLPANIKRYLPSANVVFSHLTDANGKLVAVKAQGGGFGHTVGMSQLGASGMAKAGFSFPAILQHYYTGTALGTLPLTASSDFASETHYRIPARQNAAPTLHALFPCESRTLDLRLNTKPYRLDPKTSKPGYYKAALPVGTYTYGNSNTLLLEALKQPLENKESCAPKVWLEVVAAK